MPRMSRLLDYAGGLDRAAEPADGCWIVRLTVPPGLPGQGSLRCQSAPEVDASSTPAARMQVRIIAWAPWRECLLKQLAAGVLGEATGHPA